MCHSQLFSQFLTGVRDIGGEWESLDLYIKVFTMGCLRWVSSCLDLINTGEQAIREEQLSISLIGSPVSPGNSRASLRGNVETYAGRFSPWHKVAVWNALPSIRLFPPRPSVCDPLRSPFPLPPHCCVRGHGFLGSHVPWFLSRGNIYSTGSRTSMADCSHMCFSSASLSSGL